MHDELSIGPAPTDEECAQVGQPGYCEQARRECRAYRELIRRSLGLEPEGARLVIKTNAHDFGNYLDVVCLYDSRISEAVDYALRCESDGPEEWDDLARKQLATG